MDELLKIAQIFDANCRISIELIKGVKSVAYMPTFVIQRSDKNLINMIHARFGGMFLCDGTRLRIVGAKVYDMARLMMPIMNSKKEHWGVILELEQFKGQRDTTGDREALRLKIKNLKKQVKKVVVKKFTLAVVPGEEVKVFALEFPHITGVGQTEGEAVANWQKKVIDIMNQSK